MDYSESCDKLNNKLQSDQNKLKDKQQELDRLNNDLRLVEERLEERKQLNSRINEKTKSIELLFRKVKANFESFPDQLDDLDAYAKQALQNKHKFEVPINEFQKSLHDSLTKLNDEIGHKIDAIKSKYQLIIGKLQVKKERLEQLTNASLSKYDRLRDGLNEENQNIVRLEEEIKNKQNLDREYAAEKVRIAEQSNQLKLKAECTLKANQRILEEIDQLNGQFKKADEDKRSIESKIKMQDELIDCTRLMIQELENNISSNVNYQKYKGEYDELEAQVKRLESEYEDRARIYQMKAHCKELRDREVGQINKVLQRMKAVEVDENLGDEEREAQYKSILGEIEREIRSLESELESKGLASQLHNLTQQAGQSNVVTQQTQQSPKADCVQPKKDEPDEPPKTKSETNKFELVPTELRGYLYDTKAILFGSQDEEDQNGETNESIGPAEPASFPIESRPEDCLFTSSYGLDEFTNPVIPEIFTSSVPLATQSDGTQIDDDRLQANSQPSAHTQTNESTSLQVSKSSTLINQDRAFASLSSSSARTDPCGSQFQTPRLVQGGDQEPQTKNVNKRKKQPEDSDKAKRKRQN